MCKSDRTRWLAEMQHPEVIAQYRFENVVVNTGQKKVRLSIYVSDLYTNTIK